MSFKKKSNCLCIQPASILLKCKREIIVVKSDIRGNVCLVFMKRFIYECIQVPMEVSEVEIDAQLCCIDVPF
jgi:hypothetical protein